MQTARRPHRGDEKETTNKVMPLSAPNRRRRWRSMGGPGVQVVPYWGWCRPPQRRPVTDWPSLHWHDQMTWLLSLICVVKRRGGVCVHVSFNVSVMCECGLISQRERWHERSQTVRTERQTATLEVWGGRDKQTPTASPEAMAIGWWSGGRQPPAKNKDIASRSQTLQCPHLF